LAMLACKNDATFSCPISSYSLYFSCWPDKVYDALPGKKQKKKMKDFDWQNGVAQHSGRHVDKFIEILLKRNDLTAQCEMGVTPVERGDGWRGWRSIECGKRGDKQIADKVENKCKITWKKYQQRERERVEDEDEDEEK